MREELLAVLETDGWSKVAMGKLRKLDSFIKESQRVNGVGACASTLSSTTRI